MRNIDIDGVVYKAHNKHEISYGACEAVEELHNRHMFSAVHMHKYIDLAKEGANEDEILRVAHAALFDSSKDLAHFVQIQKLDERLLTASLVFDIDYDELKALPRSTVLRLISEAEKEVGSAMDFLSGLGISIESTTLKESPKGKENKKKKITSSQKAR